MEGQPMGNVAPGLNATIFIGVAHYPFRVRVVVQVICKRVRGLLENFSHCKRYVIFTLP